MNKKLKQKIKVIDNVACKYPDTILKFTLEENLKEKTKK